MVILLTYGTDEFPMNGKCLNIWIYNVYAIYMLTFHVKFKRVIEQVKTYLNVMFRMLLKRFITYLNRGKTPTNP